MYYEVPQISQLFKKKSHELWILYYLDFDIPSGVYL